MNITQRLTASICALLNCLASASYAADEKPTNAPEKITFDDHVKPILREHCVFCHEAGEKEGGLAMDTYAALFEGGASGQVLNEDGDLESSRFWKLISHSEEPIMPPGSDRIPDDQLAIVRRWLEMGALKDSGSKAKKKKANALSFVVSSGGRPEGGGAMPQSIPQATRYATERPAATTAIAASPWAPLIAVAGHRQIVLYHGDTAELLGVLPFPEGIAQSLRFSKDGSYLIAGGGEHSVLGKVVVYDVKTGERMATVGDELDTVFDADVNDRVSRVALGGPKKMLRIYEVGEEAPLFEIKKHTDWIYTVAFSPDGVLIASGDRSGGLCVWEAETGRLYLDLVGHKGGIHSVAWRDDSNVLASASADGVVKLWDMNSGKAIKSINIGGPALDVSFDHQGRLVTAGGDNKAKLWKADGGHLRDFPSMPEDVLEVEISHDGKRVIYGDWTGSVMLVSTEGKEPGVPLASNPPSNEARIKELEEKVAAANSEFQIAKQQQTAKQQAANAAADALKQHKLKTTTAQKAVADANASIKDAEKSLKDLDNGINAQASQSRDSIDRLIAARVLVLESPDAKQQKKLVEREQQLAQVMNQLVASRLSKSKQQAALVELQKKLGETQKQVTTLSAGLSTFEGAAQNAAAEVQAAAAAAKPVEVALNQLKAKLERLRKEAAEVQ
ncbi:MAG: c-type cytochrome domain-containing protein [Planctomycetota bacterium]